MSVGKFLKESYQISSIVALFNQCVARKVASMSFCSSMIVIMV